MAGLAWVIAFMAFFLFNGWDVSILALGSLVTALGLLVGEELQDWLDRHAPIWAARNRSLGKLMAAYFAPVLWVIALSAFGVVIPKFFDVYKEMNIKLPPLTFRLHWVLEHQLWLWSLPIVMAWLNQRSRQRGSLDGFAAINILAILLLGAGCGLTVISLFMPLIKIGIVISPLPNHDN